MNASDWFSLFALLASSASVIYSRKSAKAAERSANSAERTEDIAKATAKSTEKSASASELSANAAIQALQFSNPLIQCIDLEICENSLIVKVKNTGKSVALVEKIHVLARETGDIKVEKKGLGENVESNNNKSLKVDGKFKILFVDNEKVLLEIFYKNMAGDCVKYTIDVILSLSEGGVIRPCMIGIFNGHHYEYC